MKWKANRAMLNPMVTEMLIKRLIFIKEFDVALWGIALEIGVIGVELAPCIKTRSKTTSVFILFWQTYNSLQHLDNWWTLCYASTTFRKQYNAVPEVHCLQSPRSVSCSEIGLEPLLCAGSFWSRLWCVHHEVFPLWGKAPYGKQSFCTGSLSRG